MAVGAGIMTTRMPMWYTPRLKTMPMWHSRPRLCKSTFIGSQDNETYACGTDHQLKKK